MAVCALTKCESWIGAVSCALCSAFFGILPPIMLLGMADAAMSPLVACGIVRLVALAELWLFCTIWSRMAKGDHPMAIAVAIRQPHYWALLRPLVGLFWLLHVVLPLYAGLTALPADFGSPEQIFGSVVAGVLWIVGMAYAANVFLLLAVVAVTGQERHAHSLWKHRWSWDIGIGLTVATARLLFGDAMEGLF